MSESGKIKNTSVVVSRSASERAKSLRDIDNQYSRIENRLYRQYLDYDIDEDTYNRRMQTIKNAYDRYQTNYVRAQGATNWRRGMQYPRNLEYDKPVKRSTYAK